MAAAPETRPFGRAPAVGGNGVRKNPDRGALTSSACRRSGLGAAIRNAVKQSLPGSAAAFACGRGQLPSGAEGGIPMADMALCGSFPPAKGGADGRRRSFARRRRAGPDDDGMNRRLAVGGFGRRAEVSPGRPCPARLPWRLPPCRRRAAGSGVRRLGRDGRAFAFGRWPSIPRRAMPALALTRRA